MSMSKTYTYAKPTVAQLTERIATRNAIHESREQRINDCQVEFSDCALSMWAGDIALSELNAQLELAKSDYKQTYNVLYRNGVRVEGKIVTFKSGYSYGYVTKWVIDGKFYPCYHSSDEGRKVSNFKKLGFSWVQEELVSHVELRVGGIGACASVCIRPDEFNIIAHRIH